MNNNYVIRVNSTNSSEFHTEHLAGVYDSLGYDSLR
jgi:hypothetical protein